MSRAAAPPPVCDGPGCGKQKQESNRWWQALVLQSSKFEIVLKPGTSSEFDESLFTPYDFCGQTCALKWMSEQMGKVTS